MWLDKIINWFKALWKWVNGLFKPGGKGSQEDKPLCPGIEDSGEIIQTQCFLGIMGFPIGSGGPNQDGVDGIMGAITEAAVKLFQLMVKLKPEGTLNRETLSKLRDAYQRGMDFRKLTFLAYQEGIRPDFNNFNEQGTFINTVYFYAIIEEQDLKIPAAATTAQAALETGYGSLVPTDEDTGQYSYNLFGIKGVGPAGSVVTITHEEDPQSGRLVPIKQRFRAYYSFDESIRDHSLFFHNNQRYRKALETNTVGDFIQKIAEAGYATDSNYAAKLMAIIRYWNLK
ncbi:MAG: glucosaminidase domain-containing protein [Bacteroidota bacterium]